uniref:Uncharacterized protein n=1 Tax=Callorhinchus milii TaxID=7868 RepID=A0A4W3HN34_CALMI
LGLVSYIAAKVSSHNTMPCRVVLFVKFLQDRSTKNFSQLHTAVVLLHLFCHIGILNDRFSFRHGEGGGGMKKRESNVF